MGLVLSRDAWSRQSGRDDLARSPLQMLRPPKPVGLKTTHPNERKPLLAQRSLCLVVFRDAFSGIAWLVLCCLGFLSTRATILRVNLLKHSCNCPSRITLPRGGETVMADFGQTDFGQN